MIVLRLQADNILNFKEFDVGFSYPKRISNSTIESEHLAGFPNFRYKKAVVFLGSNATGKTCLGKVISGFVQYLNSGHDDFMLRMAQKDASFSLTFINESPILYKVSTQISGGSIKTQLYEYEIKAKDSFETAESHLKLSNCENILAIQKRVGVLNCQFAYPEISPSLEITDDNRNTFLITLKCIIGTLDPTLRDVVISKEIDNSFIIKRGTDNIIIQEGRLLNQELLSSGTVEGIDVALFMASMLSTTRKFYYCDEHFSYIQSDIEKRLFSIMVGNLKEGEQLFFTTHNIEMLDLNVPKHTFAFLRRDCNGYPSVVFADSILKRNTDSVKCAFENDVFYATPDLSLLNELEHSNRKTEYLVEGNCEKALIDAIKGDPALVTPGKVYHIKK